MAKHLMALIVPCLMVMGTIFLGMGCGPDDKKDVSMSPPPVSESVEPGTQISDTKLETEQTGHEPVSAPEVGPDKLDKGSTDPEAAAITENVADTAPPAEFTLASGLWETHTKSAPLFTHENHIKVHQIACSECHHVYEQGKNVWKEGMPVQKCEVCHDEPTIKNEKKLPQDIQKKNLKLAFHGNCRGCHKPLKKADPESKAPVSCNQCHPKK